MARPKTPLTEREKQTLINMVSKWKQYNHAKATPIIYDGKLSEENLETKRENEILKFMMQQNKQVGLLNS